MIKGNHLIMRSFLIYAKCTEYTTMPYNPCGNSQCKHFNHTLFGLMHSLDQEQKHNWPIYLPSLVYAYNATPPSTTGFQPYKLIFGCKAPMPCDNWLGLGHCTEQMVLNLDRYHVPKLRSLSIRNSLIIISGEIHS